MSLKFSVSDGYIKCNGQRVYIKGANWFGLENDTFSLHGLWAVPFDTILNFLKDYNFNAVRLPISVECIEKMGTIQPQAINPNYNPDLVNMTVEKFIDIVIGRFKDAGILVMLDLHLLRAKTVIPDLWYDDEYPEARSTSALVRLVKRYMNHWNVFAVDLKNEPHGIATWGEGPSVGPTATDWAAAAERIGNAVLDACPRMLIFVEGVEGQQRADSWWGGYFGFIKFNKRKVVLKIPERLVYSPHVYGPSVWPKKMFAAPDFPQNMLDDWLDQWAFLKKKKTNPAICLGEWGGRATDTNGADGKRPDLTWQRALAEFLALNDIRDTFYWTINPNSGDTGGLLQDDWTTPHDLKLEIIGHVTPNPTRFSATQAVTSMALPPPRPWPTVLPGLKPFQVFPIGPPRPADPRPGNNNPTNVNKDNNAAAADDDDDDDDGPETDPTDPSKYIPNTNKPPVTSTSQGVSISYEQLSSFKEGNRTMYRCDVTITNNTQVALGAQFRLQEISTSCEITMMWNMTIRGSLELVGLPTFVVDAGGLKPGRFHKFGMVCTGGRPVFQVIARG